MNGTEFARVSGSYSTAFIGSWELVSQNIPENYSVIRLYGYFYYGGGTVVNSTYSLFKLHGDTLKTGSYSYTPGDHQLGTKEITVYHNEDGTFPATKAAVYAKSYHMEGEVAGTITGAASIPRKATILTAPNFKHTENPSITFQNPGGFPVNARIEFGSNEKINRLNVPSGTGETTYTFSLTNEERNQLLAACGDAKSMTARFVVGTTIGGGTSETHWSWLDRTMTVDEAAAKPTFSAFTYQDANPAVTAVTGNNQTLVSGLSTLRVTISAGNKAAAAAGASIKKYVLTCGSQTKEAAWSSSADVTLTIAGPTSGTFSVKAVDSRGLETAVTKTTTFIPYTKPVIRSAKVLRENGIGESVTLSLSAQVYTALKLGNLTNSVQSISYRYRRTGTTGWQAGTTAITPGTSVSQAIVGDTDAGFAMAQSYDLELTVEDLLSSSTVSLTISSGVPVVDMYRMEDAVGISIGSLYDAQKGGLLQMAGTPLMESGGNANSKWIKFHDGTMICTMQKQYTGAINNAEGGLYYGTRISLGDYPQAFTEIWSVQATLSGTLSGFLDTIKSGSLTTPGTINVYRASALTAVDLTIHITAIGRWK